MYPWVATDDMKDDLNKTNNGEGDKPNMVSAYGDNAAWSLTSRYQIAALVLFVLCMAYL